MAGEPEDARRGTIAAVPGDEAEARADREMADAERAVALGTATDEQRTAVDRIAHARTQEERRSVWMGGSAS
ncbi:hypothetical protein [Actinomycetospora termitidis]|uniref:Uncharacterized protein n=1 Tax=Actinomycetospora termitidis TaxID=3053470 RepID=A0ABT7M1Q4_9PSEU|nr:hypothetical protein [Actinomycetospora sp. Odt1-22]MDL5154584.1 hypothetical protein [Actinomycetospora sp. Odt1-22]